MLTDEKKAKIQEFRKDGYGYKAISILISETRDSVRNYCRKTGMTGNTATKKYTKHSARRSRCIQKNKRSNWREI